MKRVNGALAVSRALGDFSYKQRDDLPAVEQQVSGEADIKVEPRDGTEEFLIIACDGIWDVVSNDDCGAYVRQVLKNFESPEREISWAARDLLDNCLVKNSRDNMSALLVGFAADGNMHVGEEPRPWTQILSDEFVVTDRDGNKVSDPQRKDMADHLPEEDPNKTVKIADLY